MAQNRTFQFFGNAYGNTPVSLTATVNGTTVFSGEVSTINAIIPVPPPTLDAPLFSVDNSPLFSTDFSGAYPMVITVDAGDGIIVGPVQCNYMFVDDGTPANPGTAYPGNATSFISCFNNGGMTDPRSNVAINGNPKTHATPPNGTWYYTVYSGEALTCDLNILLGNVG